MPKENLSAPPPDYAACEPDTTEQPYTRNLADHAMGFALVLGAVLALIGAVAVIRPIVGSLPT